MPRYPLPAEFKRPWLLGDERIRTAFQNEPVLLMRDDFSPESRRGLKQRVRDAFAIRRTPLLRVVSRSQAGNSATHDRNMGWGSSSCCALRVH
jgi:isocitrate dehydrogenase kinase/phosphatase